ncbi:MAG TPA: response regulator [Burkholderiaceae bacterium]|nr:response regulator [Burkholderiaceae bacterium]HMX09364.1 response regulator [Burkholderiaceae bacterium]HMZ00312.1 response regulator [Burkholderiaceae bacterium]HNB44440.1 response regulator [Burkholderiaceae bacterium]HNG80042.1 response regulator [Burkholderiaceae bacterium]
MKKTILVVDDSSSLRALVKLSLGRAGFDVLEAADGRQALTQLEQAPKVHLVVSDVNMPSMDGITFLQEVKKHPRHRFTPVIMLTTEDSGTRMAQAKAAGAKAWLLKPFNPPMLLDAVSRVIPH